MDGKFDRATLDHLELETQKTLVVRLRDFARRHPTVVASTAVLLILVILTVASPYLSSNPLDISRETDSRLLQRNTGLAQTIWAATFTVERSMEAESR